MLKYIRCYSVISNRNLFICFENAKAENIAIRLTDKFILTGTVNVDKLVYLFC